MPNEEAAEPKRAEDLTDMRKSKKPRSKVKETKPKRAELRANEAKSRQAKSKINKKNSSWAF